jgi:hypothetical protein
MPVALPTRPAPASARIQPLARRPETRLPTAIQSNPSNPQQRMAHEEFSPIYLR